MHTTLLEILGCPKCLRCLTCTPLTTGTGGEIESGSLKCAACSRSYPIVEGIPRFIDTDNYAASFGYQWNRFKAEQIDSLNGSRLSEKRFYSETNWTADWMRNKWILDAGSGAGRFLDVASKNDCQIVGVDISNATDAARAMFGDRKNLHLVQASIYELPFLSEVFDGCYCIGVIQHTPDPQRALKSLPRILKRRGRLAVTIYERKRWTMLNTKYLIRPVTKRLSQKLLLKIIQLLMPPLFALTEVLFRIPYLGGLFSFIIPVANYVNESELTFRQRYRWAVLDTFDMLSPQYDRPQKEEDSRQALKAGGLDHVERLGNPGLNLIGAKIGCQKAAETQPQTSPSSDSLWDGVEYGA